MKNATGSFQVGGEVHALEHRADLARPVAEVVDREVGGVGVLLRPRVAGRHRRPAADDRVRAESTRFEPLQVHRAAASAAVALREPEDLGERALQHLLDLGGDERAEVGPDAADVGERLREELVVAAVRAVDRIGRAQADDRADRAALLPDAGVRRPVDEPLAGELEHGLFEGADEVQLREHPGQQRRVGALPVGGRGGQLDPRRSGLQAAVLRHRSRPSSARGGALPFTEYALLDPIATTSARSVDDRPGSALHWIH